MTSFSNTVSRRAWMLGAAGAAIASPFIARSPASAAGVPNIRYATGGGIGPNEMETIIFLDHLKQNVLKNYGKAYTLDMTFTRGTPEAASLLAAGQADVATLSGRLSPLSSSRTRCRPGSRSFRTIIRTGMPVTRPTVSWC
ncbi:MAG: hypothetical protein WDN50_24535 [Bradyrhizobium sp.]